MKILFAIGYVGFFRYFDAVIRDLCAADHTVEVLFDFRHDQIGVGVLKLDNPIRALLACELEMNSFHWGWCLPRRDRWRRILFAMRKVANYCSYLRTRRQPSRMILQRYEGFLPKAIHPYVNRRIVRAVLSSGRAQTCLRSFERLMPPDRAITRWLQDHRPDVIVASPVLMAGFDEFEYLKAGLSLGIPTLAAIMSWDHLTTKGTFPLHPDMTVVWNRTQMDEAVRLHGIPRQRVIFTGAPVFDEWFGLRPTVTRAAFCQQVGLDPQKPYALYLCSTTSVVEDETPYVEEVARGLRQYRHTDNLNLLVRPHPWYADIWEKYTHDRVTVWPREGGATADIPSARQDYFHALHYSTAVIGINTTGFIEAAILDKPCVTILDDRYRDTQRDMAHFQHLARADYLEMASGLPEAVETLAAIVGGVDARRDRRRRFVEQFVRPWGVHRRASQSLAAVIQAAARRGTYEEILAVLSADSTAEGSHRNA